MASEGSLPYSQVPATCPYPEPTLSSTHILSLTSPLDRVVVPRPLYLQEIPGTHTIGAASVV
jgi:hypothetical protein